MNDFQISFVLRLLFCCGTVFGFHLLFLDYLELQIFDAMIVEAYVVNIGLALLIYFILYALRHRFKSQLGFLFLLGSLIKFIFFFLIFNSTYKEDGFINKQEFFSFFVPYVLTLIIEVYSLSNWMMQMDSKNKDS